MDNLFVVAGRFLLSSAARMTPGPREWTIGTNTFRFEPPDLLWVKLQGECSREEAVQIVKLYRELAADQPYFVLSDMQASMGMDPEAKRYMSENIASGWFLGVILFNTRLLHRALAKGVVLAAALTRAPDDPPRTRIQFVSTREKALELLAQWRAQADGGPE
jgi:hypothetical protein